MVSTTRTDLSANLKTASAVVSAHLEGRGIGEAVLEQIELYLAAHFAVLSDPDSPHAAVYEKLDGAETRYRGKDGEGFKATLFGQQALVLDPTGRLAELGGARASLVAIDSTKAYDYDCEHTPVDG